MKVFLLEDNTDLRIALEKVLKMYSYEVMTFSDGKDAMDYIETNGVGASIYILDINVPNCSGLDILKSIKANQFIDEQHIIMISAYHDIDIIREAYKHGCKDYMKKPFDAEELILKISNFKKEQSHIIRLKNGLVYNVLTKELFSYHTLIELTSKELLLIDKLFKSSPYLVSQENIEEYVYDGASVTSEVVRSLIRRVRKKIGNDVIFNKVNFGYYIPEDLLFKIS